MNINHQLQKKTKGLKCEMKNKKFFLITGIAICMLGIGLVWWLLPYHHPIKGEDKHAGYRYRIENDVIYLTRYIGKDKIVHVPKRLKGRKVVIDTYCFSGTNIEEVYIPLTVEMRDYAFHLCKKLKKSTRQ